MAGARFYHDAYVGGFMRRQYVCGGAHTPRHIVSFSFCHNRVIFHFYTG